ncbi:GNAT family N-acetyltransferase [Solwaraspora sp. WMMD406]|uniref:GNAT family N-acetyltransferase n=1 Tax=Solwaraspora sp. WMMD406 TaxID=3016095 RepID=UPI002415C163|nr:GNAT family N-acetyltransferase [Solwaraspora sp. WMMD406]MDG4763494.1 GNAT family N-acetyltransferase [Solwaraspora sp. WMMD406]
MTATQPTAVMIRTAGLDDIPQAATLLTEAFLIAPVSQWLIADLSARSRVFRTLFTIELVEAIRNGGTVYVAGPVVSPVAGHFSGVAIWHPRGRRTAADPDTVSEHQIRLITAAGPWQPRFASLGRLLAAHHPWQPHWHLAYLAVTPWRQGSGIGTALLHHHHRHLDGHGTPGYLEATTPRNRDLYLRHGYRAHGPIRLPDGPPIWPMWREPRPVTR